MTLEVTPGDSTGFTVADKPAGSLAVRACVWNNSLTTRYSMPCLQMQSGKAATALPVPICT